MEKKHLVIGAVAVSAIGAGAFLVWRRKGLGKNANPLPILSPTAPGVVANALEVDKTSSLVNVRERDAQQLITILNGYELDPGVEPVGTPPTPDTLAGAFNLRQKASTPASYFSGYPASGWLVSAAHAGFDVLINDRVTALLSGKPIPKPTSPSKLTADILVIGPADRAMYAKYGDGKDPEHHYAILIAGDAGGPKVVPPPPGGFAKGAILLDTATTETDVAKKAAAAAEVAKQVSMGLAISRAQRARLWGGARLSNDPN
jgi:hypothetical protein